MGSYAGVVVQNVFQKILDALLDFENVLDIELLHYDAPMAIVRLKVMVNGMLDSPEMRSSILEAIYAHLAPGVAVDVVWVPFHPENNS